MQESNYLVVVVAAFVASAVWYTLFANPMANLSNMGSAEAITRGVT
jgi:hypothetical protein